MVIVDDQTQLDLPWGELQGLLQGQSAIDLPTLSIHSRSAAIQFVANYGYDLDRPEDASAVNRLQADAVSFLRRCFLDPVLDWTALGEPVLEDTMPEALSTRADVCDLLQAASSGPSREQAWACAVLKVMHILCHITNAVMFRHFEEARAQILKRYQRLITTQDDGTRVLGGPKDMRLALAGFEVKDTKSQDSMVLKLLCKKENVAEEVFDLIGVRLITHSIPEALIALEILLHTKALIFPNIIPSRTRNTLVDATSFQQQYDAIVDRHQQGHLDLPAALDLIRTIRSENIVAPFNPSNPATLGTYRAIHITERQLIRVPTPEGTPDLRFFFPYELQVVDVDSYRENMEGTSAHARYKQKQRIQARRRVLGPLF